ncbi:FAD-dependent oxidoreductase [Syntrophobacter fumaroxidans]|uniref:FAD-dependent pyridine nucleotide-disulphide oxidoreductase n=1 Tax=Syntrophobacter fumaroxidans (strain DSM 10017 / MPOB) TaxID=335543 RepID=A0LQI9_SYNFM|nr:FAD-dependent oxidoreductase [Syntrophobacter fumaroxidans]ABK19691.1 FAD-dependent pyridine nucleotide-disulphide oxidoreductase [Syntrophobacter fumaroxidans MPOB]
MNAKRVVVIGAVALGPKVACRLKRLHPESDVVMVDQDEYISYGGCGIPYFISGDVSDVKELMSTSYHMERTPRFFEDAKGVRVRTRTRALSIDRKAKTVRVKDLRSGLEEDLPYDRLVLATGSEPNRLSIPGVDLPEVIGVSNIASAIAVKERIAKGQVNKALIIGAGAIGCEMAEALSDLWGIETTVVEIADQVLPIVLDRGLARMVQKHMEEKGVSIRLRETVKAIRRNGGTSALTVATSQGEIEADLVIASIGVRPKSNLAREAGLVTSPRGAVVVNRRLQTSDPDIYAGGDCIEVLHLVTGKPVFFPQGSLANRQGRVIGTNLAGGFATFNGVVGSFSIKIFDLAVASTGIPLHTALNEGFDAARALVVQADRAHFYPTQDLMYLEVIADRKTRRVLGAQGIARNGDALTGRINAIAAMLPYRPLLEDLANMEVAYSPPFASALDIVNAAANTAENILDGINRPVDPEEFEKCFLDAQADDAVCLDVRGPANAAPFVAYFGERWLNVPQETLKQRMAEVPRDKRLFVLCNSGARSYEALRQLETAGLCEAVNVQGGVAALKKSGLLELDHEEDTTE